MKTYVVMMGQLFLARLNSRAVGWVAEYPDAMKFTTKTKAIMAFNVAGALLSQPAVLKIVQDYGTDKQKEV